jgi:hypothetical protein
VGFANSFVFEFTGRDANLAGSLANFSLVQPLLRGAGRDVALEQLTIAERALLANLRAYSQYRQGFYTQIAIGELGVLGPLRGGGTSFAVFPGQGGVGTGLGLFPGQGVGGYIGLLQQLQQIRNSEDSLGLQVRNLSRLEAYLEFDLIDLVQVDQFRQSVENERSSLLQSRNAFELSLDRYKTGTLGLPPDLPTELDDGLIRQFQFVAREATAVQDSIVALQDRVGKLPKDASVEAIRQVIADAFKCVEPVRRRLDDVRADLARMEEAVQGRERAMTEEDRKRFQDERKRLWEELTRRNELEEKAGLEQKVDTARAKLEGLRDRLSEQTRSAVAHDVVVWVSNFYVLAQGSMLIQARARLETVTVETIELSSQDALKTALANRLDFMNARAALADRWRSIQFSADALQSVLNVTAGGDVRTARNNPVSFRAPTGTLRLGLEFDAPLTRVLERNAYRESLIDYQQSRRDFIQSCDSLHVGLRGLLRQIEQLRTALEIQRRAVAIAIRRVDVTQAALYAPVPPPPPGQRPAQFGPTAAFNLLSAQSALRDTQDTFMSLWLSYYAARMRLARELGVMKLDGDGRWMDSPLPGSRGKDSLDAAGSGPEELPMPPAVPTEWIELVDRTAPLPTGPPPADVQKPVGGSPAAPPTGPTGLPPAGGALDPRDSGLLPKRSALQPAVGRPWLDGSGICPKSLPGNGLVSR